MGKKKRGHADIEDIINRPWCYYCERDFEDLKLLISHQKAKHFKCDRCGKRLNTAGGLSVHMNQVHKESLASVENALPNRQGLDVEIFGMEGVPDDMLQQHNQRLIQQYYTEQAERRAATGNPPPGTVKGPCTKKFKMETADEVKKRFRAWRAEQDALKARAPSSGAAGGGQNLPRPAQPFPPPFSAGAAPAAAGHGGFVPLRPPYYANGGASTVDELIASASGAPPDDIDQLIRMAEAGIKPPAPVVVKVEDATEKKSSRKERDRNMRMVYADLEVSPEEKMAMLPRYAFAPEEA